MDIKSLVNSYTKSNITIAVLGSHSALDVCRGAKDEGFKTLVITEKGRGKTYSKYYFSKNGLGCVDEVIELEKFSDILNEKVQKQLLKRNAIFIPHRSFEVYINDYNSIENKFKVPMFGNRKLLRFEERSESPNQYDLLEKGGIRYPRQFKDPKDIDRLVIVKVQEKIRGYERAFFLIKDYREYKQYTDHNLREGLFTEEQLKTAVIEEFIIGVQVNFNFFYDPLNKKLELMGTDTRRQTNLDGFLRLTAGHQGQIGGSISVTYEEAGHIAVTVLESLLEQAFEIGEKFVKASQEVVEPGVIGPFGLQSMIIPGPPKKDIVVFDVSPRIPGSPGIWATPYSSYLYGQPVSAGKRVAMEIKEAVNKKHLKKILT